MLIAEGKISEIALDPTNDSVRVDITKYDDAYLKKHTSENGVLTSVITAVKKGNVDIKGLQGLSLTMKIDIADMDNPTLVSAVPKEERNEEFVIAHELFEGASDGRLLYKKDLDTATVSTAKTEVPFNIYVNLVKVGGFSTTSSLTTALDSYELASSDVGTSNINEFKFVDTDGNGAYDTLFIDESASFVVDRVDVRGKEIYALNSSMAMNSDFTSITGNDYGFYPLVLDTTNDDVTYDIKDTNGNKLSFSDIKAKDVLTVKQSYDAGYTYYDIVVSNTTVEGLIFEVSQNIIKSQVITYYKINGISYRLNGCNRNYKLEAGTNGKFYITPNNKIILVEMEKVDRFAVAIAFASTELFDKELLIRVVKGDGTVEDMKFASTVAIDGHDYKIDNLTVENKTTIKDGYSAVVSVNPGTIVMFEKNQDEEIRRLYTTAETMRWKDDDLSVASCPRAEYQATSGKLAKQYYITENTNLLGVKNALVSDTDKYSAITADMLSEDDLYDVVAVYNKSSKEIILALITNFAAKPAYDSKAMVITGIATTIVDGEKRDLLKGYIDGNNVSYTVANAEDIDFYDLGSGEAESYMEGYSVRPNEAIQFTLDKDGYINSIRKLVGYYDRDLCAVRIKANYVDDDTADCDRASEAEIFRLRDCTPVSDNTVDNFVGYGVAGKVNRINGSTIEFFKDSSISTVGELQANCNLFSTTFKGMAYFYGPTYSTVKTGSLASVKTFAGLGCDIAKLNSVDFSLKSTCEDIVYVYNYDGVNVLNYVFDVLGNSK